MDAQPQTDLKAYAERLEVLCRAQADEITRLRAELARATEGAGAHQVLQSIYRNPDSHEVNRIKAATAAISFEQPKIGSVLPSLGNTNRRERWRVYEQWSLRREIVLKTRDLPPPGWDDHLQADTYVEPPESEGMPPVDVVDTGSGFKVLTNLLPKSGDRRAVGNGGNSGDDSSSND
jgi:hypothetical protein